MRSMRFHMRALLRIVVGAWPLLAMASCSSDSGGGGGGGGSGPVSACAAVDVCAKIALDHVNTLCGIAATGATPADNASPDPSQLPDVHGCDYAGPTPGQVERECFASSSLASFYFTNEKKNTPTGGETQTDVTGVGDQAFLRDDPVLTKSTLYVLKSNLLVVVTAGWSTGGQTTADQCTQTLASDTLKL